MPDPVGTPQVEVRRSRRRRRTVTAYRDGDTVVVLLPASMSRADEQHWVAKMLSRLERSEARRKSPRHASDEALLARCRQLSGKYLDGRAEPVLVRWVPAMRTRWGSATPEQCTIRISERLREVPGWVLDYVLVHELAHLIVPAHGPRFWELVHRYPRTERAIGYLEGLSAAARLDCDPEENDPEENDPEEKNPDEL